MSLAKCSRCAGPLTYGQILREARFCSATCRKAAWRHANPEKRAATVAGKRDPEAHRAAVELYAGRNKEKLAVRRQVRTAIAQGGLVPEPCLFCSAPRVDAHHHDYTLPLAVTWLCRQHHRLVHRSQPCQ